MYKKLKVWFWMSVLSFGFACGLLGFGFGREKPLDPDPEQCLSVCVAEFERMGC